MKLFDSWMKPGERLAIVFVMCCLSFVVIFILYHVFFYRDYHCVETKKVFVPHVIGKSVINIYQDTCTKYVKNAVK